MSPRTSTAEAILQALEAGPATAEQLHSGSRRRQGLIDKALTDLANDGRIVSVQWDEDPDDKPHWQLANPTSEISPESDLEPDGQAPNDDTGETDKTSSGLTADVAGRDLELAQSSADEESPADHASMVSKPDEIVDSGQDASEITGEETETTGGTEPGDDDSAISPASTAIERADRSEATDGQIVIYEPEPDQDSSGSSPATSIATDTDPEPLAEPEPGAESKPTDELAVKKVCRGCQEQMPVVCPCCRQKTSSYCGECRSKRTPRHRGTGGESEILSNGLPKLRRGELIAMVNDVMGQHHTPEFNG